MLINNITKSLAYFFGEMVGEEELRHIHVAGGCRIVKLEWNLAPSSKIAITFPH